MFDDRALPRALLEEVLALARRAPSGVNTQPWNVFVVQGASLVALKAAAGTALAQAQLDVAAQARFWTAFRTLPGHSHWAGPAWEQRGAGFAASAEAAFGAGRIGGDGDLARYFNLHGAPVALMCTIDRKLGLGSVLDYGMFLQTIVVAARARGLRAEVQTGWRGLADAVVPVLQPGEGQLLLAGVALGYPADTRPPVTATPVPADNFTLWYG
ncbi:MAG: nitroreductase family protein [Burkholderiaceae bacterium]